MSTIEEQSFCTKFEEDFYDVSEKGNPFYYSKYESMYTPASSQIPYTLEKEYRLYANDFLFLLGSTLEIDDRITYGAMLLCQLFYMRFSIMEYNYFKVATACFFYFSKEEDCTLSLDWILRKEREILEGDEYNFEDLTELDDYEAWKHEIIEIEALLLQRVAIYQNDLLALEYLEKYAFELKVNSKVFRAASVILKDTMRCSFLSLHFSQDILACAALKIGLDFFASSNEHHPLRIHIETTPIILEASIEILKLLDSCKTASME